MGVAWCRQYREACCVMLSPLSHPHSASHRSASSSTAPLSRRTTISTKVGLRRKVLRVSPRAQCSSIYASSTSRSARPASKRPCPRISVRVRVVCILSLAHLASRGCHAGRGVSVCMCVCVHVCLPACLSACLCVLVSVCNMPCAAAQEGPQQARRVQDRQAQQECLLLAWCCCRHSSRCSAPPRRRSPCVWCCEAVQIE